MGLSGFPEHLDEVFDETENEENNDSYFSDDDIENFIEDEVDDEDLIELSLIHISEPTRPCGTSRMPSSA